MNEMQSICICGCHMERGYSGGRYCAWVLGEALAAAGFRVTLWTNAYPKYAEDFADYALHDSIKCHIDPTFTRLPRGRFEWVLIVPDHDRRTRVYQAWLHLAAQNRAQVALLNFETPNWFNSMVDVAADERLWDNWRMVSRYCSQVISLAEESTKFARKFYTDVPRGCRFVTCPPAVNSRSADRIGDVQRENQLLVITRLGGRNFKHKGADDLIAAIGPAMAGRQLTILAGMASARGKVLKRIKSEASRHNVTLRVIHEVTDETKFTEIKKSKLMLFLSEFEGFGYPPVEALYCNTPCIAYDLPVLREISGDGLTYVRPKDHIGLCKAIAEELGPHDDEVPILRASVAHIAPFESLVVRLSRIFASEDIFTSVWEDDKLDASEVVSWRRSLRRPLNEVLLTGLLHELKATRAMFGLRPSLAGMAGQIRNKAIRCISVLCPSNTAQVIARAKAFLKGHVSSPTPRLAEKAAPSVRQARIPDRNYLYERDSLILALVNKACNEPDVRAVIKGFDALKYDERVVEYPYVAAWLANSSKSGALSKELLDVGCVMNSRIIQPVVDRFCNGIWFCNPVKEKVVHFQKPVYYHAVDLDHAFENGTKFPLITCLSTIEHIGYDNSQYGGTGQAVYSEPDVTPLLTAVRKLAELLGRGGKLLVSFPYGFPEVQTHPVTGKISSQVFGWNSVSECRSMLTEMGLLSCLEVFLATEKGWVQTDSPEDCRAKYADGCPAAQAVAFLDIGCIRGSGE
jgi:glycosyltransferase involved in cell wall biosynthesis